MTIMSHRLNRRIVVGCIGVFSLIGALGTRLTDGMAVCVLARRQALIRGAHFSAACEGKHLAWQPETRPANRQAAKNTEIVTLPMPKGKPNRQALTFEKPGISV
jgi:hypothetical protein